MSPILRRLAQQKVIDLQVAFCSLRGAKASLDPEFGTSVQWDVPLLDGFEWAEIHNRGSGGEGFWGLFNPGLWKIVREGRYDAVICLTGYIRASFWIAYFAARRSRSAFVFGTDATDLTPRDSRRWKMRIKRVLWPRLFKLADQVIVGSSAGVEMMRSLGISSERITLTPFAVDNDWWSAQAALVDRLTIRRTWGVSAEALIVLFCAKLQSWKRPYDLLRAFAAAAVPDSVLIFAGEGPARELLTTEAGRLGISSRVKFLGFTNQTELPAVYSAADLFVLPSEYDPCPVVVCEAMLCGLPVLLSDEIRGRFDLVKSGITGDIFPCGRVDVLSERLQTLLSSRSLLKKLGQNARLRMNSWSPEDNIRATIAAISSAIRHRQAAGFRDDSSNSDSTISSGANNS